MSMSDEEAALTLGLREIWADFEAGRIDEDECFARCVALREENALFADAGMAEQRRLEAIGDPRQMAIKAILDDMEQADPMIPSDG